MAMAAVTATRALGSSWPCRSGRPRCLLALATFLFTLAIACHQAKAAGPVVIQTGSGVVQGLALPSARVWKGLPYALPPVGSLRWQNPEPITPWSGVKVTQAFGPACPQKCNLPPLTCQPLVAEDCLTLNVYTPLEAAPTMLPVLVFFHGGRYEQGSEGVELYDGQVLANESNVIVVTANYRLGVLGFMTLPSGFTGNYGIRDQRLALQWVQDNIAAFGGDPRRVTIFGQSAGATSVSVHLVSAQSKNLFHQAIVESSPYSLPLLTSEAAYDHYEHFAREANCLSSDTACLLNCTWQEVVEAQTKAQAKIYLDRPLVLFFPWTPVVDGDLITSDPLTLINQGNYNKVPVVIGNVGQEAWLFVYEAFGKLNRAETELLVDAIFRVDPKSIFDLYQLPEQADDYRPWVSYMASDFIIRCSSRNVSNALARDVPVYRYEFNHSWSETGGWGPNYTYCEGVPCHGVELPFVFNSASLVDFSFSSQEKALANVMSRAWASFATTGSVNGPGLPPWPSSVPGTDAVMRYSTEGNIILNNYRKEYCDFWDNYGYIF